MSIQSILQESAKKGRGKKPRKHFGGVNATDDRYTGTEPVWDDWQSWPAEKFAKERSRAFNFYNYYLDAKETKPRVIEWMAANGYSETQIAAVKAAPDWSPGITVGTLCTCMLRGMPPTHPQLEYTSDAEFVKDSLKASIIVGTRAINDSKAEVSAKAVKPAVSPQELLRLKVNRTIIAELDSMIDSWVTLKDYSPIDLYGKLQQHSTPAMACGMVEDFLVRHRDEAGAALSGDDSYLKEAYSVYSKAALQKQVEAYNKMLGDLNKYKHAVKATRAPRQKKPVSTEKQISNLKYCKQNPDYKLTSINPARIPGSYRLLAFNTKYRMLIDYVAQSSAGLSIKGTTLQNLDEANCRCIRLRKPDEVLSTIISATPKQIQKTWDSLSTKESKPKGRINEEVILLRVFENRD